MGEIRRTRRRRDHAYGLLESGFRQSWSNQVYIHIGHFASAGEAFAKALVLGGVTKRFPTQAFAFLEGGAGWAALLYNDFIGHYEKRSRACLERNNAAYLDRDAQAALIQEWGSSQTTQDI